MNRLRTAFGKLVTLKRIDGRHFETGKNEIENRQVGNEGGVLRDGRSIVNRAIYDTLGLKNEQEGGSIMAGVLKSGFSAASGRVEQVVPSYRSPITSTISGLHSQNNIPSNAVPHNINEHPNTAKDATVTIEQTWLLEDAVQKGRLDKSNALGEEIVVPSKSRLHLPSILRRTKKPVAQATETTKKEKKYNVETVSTDGPSVLAPTNTDVIKDLLDMHADVFKKVKLPDIHRSDGRKDEAKLVEADSGMSKEEKRAKKKKEKRERIERERRERKEKKKHKEKHKENKSKNSKDDKKERRVEEKNGEETSSSTVAGVSNVEHGQKDGNSKTKKSKARNILSSSRRAKTTKSKPVTLLKADDFSVNKDGECAKADVGDSGRTLKIECVNSEKKISQSNDDSTEGTSLVASGQLKKARLDRSCETTTKVPVDIPGKRDTLPLPISPRKEKESVAKEVEGPKTTPVASLKLKLRKDDSVDIHGKEVSSLQMSARKEKESVAQEVKGPKTTPVASLKLKLRKDDSVDSSTTHTSMSSKPKTRESTSFASKRVQGGVKDRGMTGQIDVKAKDKIIDVDGFKTNNIILEPPTVKKNLVSTTSRTAAAQCITFEGTKKRSFRHTLADTYSVGKISGADLPGPCNFYSSLEQEDSAKVEELLSVETKEKGKCEESLKKVIEPGTVASKNIQVSAHLSNPVSTTKQNRPQDNSVKPPPSQPTKKELPPVYNPKQQHKYLPTPPKATQRKHKNKGNSQGLPPAGPSEVPPFMMKCPPKILPAIRTKTPEFFMPGFPLTVDAGSPLRYIQSDEESEEEIEAITRGILPLRTQDTPMYTVSANGLGFEPFHPQPPAIPKPQNGSEMLRKRAKRLMSATFKSHLPDKETPSTIPDTEPQNNGSPQVGCAYGAMEERADQKAWDLMIEDYECSDEDLHFL